MKIVFLAPFGIRPKGTLLARMLPLAVELQALGHQVAIIAPPYTNPEDSGKVETVWGVRVRNIDINVASGGLATAILAWRMYRAALAEEPDMVHLFKPKGYGGMAAMLLLLLRGMGLRLPPLFVDCDDWEGRGGMNDLHPYSSMARRLFQLQEDWLPPRAAAVTVASRTLQTKVWGQGLPPEKVLYIPNCVIESPLGDGLGVRARFGIDPAAPVLLLYTRFFEFSQAKLHFLLADIHRRVPGVRFLVVGKGRKGEEGDLERAALSEGFKEALCMAGWLEPELIPDYLAAGDVALYPFSDTLINRSKCPAKLTELLVSGVAVVADRVGQLAEYIDPGVGGLLCDPDNWQEMADKAVMLLMGPDQRRIFGANGRSYMLEHFSWQQFAIHLDEFYRTRSTHDRP